MIYVLVNIWRFFLFACWKHEIVPRPLYVTWLTTCITYLYLKCTEINTFLNIFLSLLTFDGHPFYMWPRPFKMRTQSPFFLHPSKKLHVWRGGGILNAVCTMFNSLRNINNAISKEQQWLKKAEQPPDLACSHSKEHISLYANKIFDTLNHHSPLLSDRFILASDLPT